MKATVIPRYSNITEVIGKTPTDFKTIWVLEYF